MSERRAAPTDARLPPFRPLLGRLLSGHVAALLLVASTARGDLIVLKNGNEIQGEVVDRDEKRLIVRFPGGTLRLKAKDVEEVRSQSRPSYLQQLGEQQMRRKSFNDAVKTFRTAVRENPGSELLGRKLNEARFRLAGDLAARRRYEESLGIYRSLQRDAPNDGRVATEIEFIKDEHEEALREEDRGRREIDSGNLETGVWRLRKVYDNFPDRRKPVSGALADGLIRQADGFRRARRHGEAAARLEEALAVSPTASDRVRDSYVECKLQMIPAFIQRSRFTEVEAHARGGLQLAPSDPALNFYLGLSLEGRGETERAAEIYASILGEGVPKRPKRRIDSLRRRAESKVAKSRPKLTDLRADLVKDVLPGGYREIVTKHFTIRHRNEHVGREVAIVAERAYEELFRAFACTTHFGSRCVIHIYPTEEEYHARVRMGEWSGAAHQLDSRRGTMSRHQIFTYQSQPRLTGGLLTHEIAHALLQSRLNHPRRVPLWANEGLAVFVEPTYMHRHYDRIVLSAHVQNLLIPIEELLSKESYPDTGVDLFYGQSLSLVRYLIAKKGIPRYVDFLRDVTGTGLSIEAALRKHYRMATPLALENRWRSTLRRGR